MILVIGSGVAGLSCALAAARAGAEVELVTPGALRGAGDSGRSAAGTWEVESGVAGLGAAELAGGSTALAQGGVAAAIGAGDRVADHASDTLGAGGGLADAEAVAALVADGAMLVRRLLHAGFPADREGDGSVSLGLEAAHGRHRIVHAGGDRTGAALHAFLLRGVLAEADAGRIVLTEGATAEALVHDAGAVVGAIVRRGAGIRETRSADAVVLATGGFAALYPRTSNPAGSAGSGIVLAARAGAAVADLEFVQFHPTVLAGEAASARGGSDAPGRGQLVSEAVRGAGALLRDGSGARFMVDRHPMAELAPRDVVSREIHRVLRERGDGAVLLDATGIERGGGTGTLARRFPGIAAATASLGLDWRREPIPVAPAAHYTMGGVLSDLDGRSTVPGLFVAGEVAATGVHGANRLASNSLLEGLVFGERAGLAAAGYAASAASDRSWRTRGRGFHEAEERCELVPLGRQRDPLDHPGERSGARRCSGSGGAESAPGSALSPSAEVRAAVGAGLGIERDAAGLAAAASVFAGRPDDDAALAAMVCTAALAREESRGAHLRADFPRTDPAGEHRRAYRFIPVRSRWDGAPADTDPESRARVSAHGYAPNGRGA